LLDEEVRRSLDFRKIAPDTWVSNDIAIGDRIINVAAHVRIRSLGKPRIAITSHELMRLGFADGD
jgi:hypothetical protein